MRLTPRRLALMFVGGSIAAAFAPWGCSLGLNPSLIGATDASTQEGSMPGEGGMTSDGATGDGPLSSKDGPMSDSPGTSSDAGPGYCSTDKDCANIAGDAAACVSSAKCDPTWHVCLLDVCGTSACQAEVCVTGTDQCSLPATYGFVAGTFPVSYGGVGGYGGSYAISAAWPYLFIETTSGVICLDVSDPKATSPRVVPLNGVPFLPVATFALGRRVYFVQNLAGSGPDYAQAVAWVDVPQNPFLTGLQAQSTLLNTTQTGIENMLTNGSNGVFVVYVGTNLPTSNFAPPFTEMETFKAFPNTSLPNGAAIVASSGAPDGGPRLVSYRYDGTAEAANFALINTPATSGALATSEQVGTFAADGGITPEDSQATFATGADGTVLWTTALYDELDGGGNDGVSTARLTWLYTSATAANIDPAAHVDLVSYSPAASGTVVGPPAWVDSNTALGLAVPNSSSNNSTLVQVATKSPLQLVAGRNTTLPVAPGSLGIAVSNGFAYVLAATDPMNQSCTVYVLAPSCGGATANDASAE